MTTTIPAGGTQDYLADRYDRLRNGAEILASDPAIENADPLHNSEALRTFVGDLVEERVLDGLSDADADTVGMLVVIDFLKGPAQIAGRIGAWLNGETLGREDDNPWAVCAVLTEILNVYLAGLAGEDFAEARANERWPGRRNGTGAEDMPRLI